MKFMNSDAKMPVVGFGTAAYPYNGDRVDEAVAMGLEVGFRHFDTARIYGSEAATGRALMAAICGGKFRREELFVTSKLWGSDHHDPVAALRQSLRNLGLEYLDLYLVHWPARFKEWATYAVPYEEDFDVLDMESTWARLERCVDLGLCKAIGVSNFSCTKIEKLLNHASIPPAVNQVEMHPCWRQQKLREFCEERNIHVSAYSPMGGPGNSWGTTAVVDSPIIKAIALKHNATPAQVALRWGIEKGASVITKTFRRERMKENLGALDIRLDEKDLVEIDGLEEWKVMRGEFLVNQTTSPYKSIQELWDGEI